MRLDIKACPECNEDWDCCVDVWHEPDSNKYWWSVGCGCGYELEYEYDDRTEAITAWNIRANPIDTPTGSRYGQDDWRDGGAQ